MSCHPDWFHKSHYDKGITPTHLGREARYGVAKYDGVEP